MDCSALGQLVFSEWGDLLGAVRAWVFLGAGCLAKMAGIAVGLAIHKTAMAQIVRGMRPRRDPICDLRFWIALHAVVATHRRLQWSSSARRKRAPPLYRFHRQNPVNGTGNVARLLPLGPCSGREAIFGGTVAGFGLGNPSWRLQTKDNGRRYFMEGYRSSGFARVLPIITPTQCSHTALLDRAGVDVRILMDGPPKSGARLIGAVGGCSLYDPRPGVSIRVDGPATSFDLVTDKQGIYDAKDLPSGIYTIHEPGGTISTVQLSEGKIERRDLCEK